MGLVRKAVVYTLLLHVVVLGALVVWPVSEGIPPSETFTEVTMLDASQAVAAQQQSFEDQLRAQMAQKVANLRADAQAEASSEARSTSDVSEAELEAQVEAELRAMEAAEFARLSAEEKTFETAGAADVTRQQVGETFESWDAQYDGLVTVRYSLEGRKGRDLDVPGYTCEGGAQIDVAIVVAANGTVLEASLASGDPESCFGAAALRSARRARFNASSDAPKRQEGRLTYVFVAQ
ncbi:MAG: cell envelope integrity protein TolA [Flavobacteriales bacterium]